jgi:hypothetical protein
MVDFVALASDMVLVAHVLIGSPKSSDQPQSFNSRKLSALVTGIMYINIYVDFVVQCCFLMHVFW